MIKAENPKPIRNFSRLTSRSLRVRGGLMGGLGFFAALAILFGVQAAAGVGRSGLPETTLDTSLSAPMPALHSVSLTRLAVAPRSSSRPSHDVGAALRPDTYDPLTIEFSPRSLPNGAIKQPRRSVVSRGYDATAPPALS